MSYNNDTANYASERSAASRPRKPARIYPVEAPEQIVITPEMERKAVFDGMLEAVKSIPYGKAGGIMGPWRLVDLALAITAAAIDGELSADTHRKIATQFINTVRSL